MSLMICVSVRLSGPTDQGSRLQSGRPARPPDQRAAGAAAVPPAVLGSGEATGQEPDGKLLRYWLQKGRGRRIQIRIDSKFSRNSREIHRLQVWRQKLEGNCSLMNWSDTNTKRIKKLFKKCWCTLKQKTQKMLRGEKTQCETSLSL